MNYGVGAPMNGSSAYAYTESSDFSTLTRAQDNVRYFKKEFNSARKARNNPNDIYGSSRYAQALKKYVNALSLLVSESKDSIYVKPEEYKRIREVYEEVKGYQNKLNAKALANKKAYVNDPYKFVYPNVSQAEGGRRKTRRVRRTNRKSRRV